MSNFSSMLLCLRQRAGMSQQELAEKSGCSRSAIGMYETGKREPDIETLGTFADIFNVDMDFLTGRVGTSEHSIRFRKKIDEEGCNESVSMETAVYPTLEGEIAKRKITKKQLAITAGICYKALYNKLHGDVPFTWPEVCAIRAAHFPDMTSDELFATSR